MRRETRAIWGILGLVAVVLSLRAIGAHSAQPQPSHGATDAPSTALVEPSGTSADRLAPGHAAAEQRARDRKAADEVRARLSVLLRHSPDTKMDAGTAGASSAGTLNANRAPLPALIPAPVGSGNQASAALGTYIRNTVHQQFFPMAGGCYDEFLQRRPRARGTIDLSVVVGGAPSVGGVVESVRVLPDSTLTDDSFVTCMVESMMALQFDAPPGDQRQVDFSYPFNLAPDEPDAEPAGDR